MLFCSKRASERDAVSEQFRLNKQTYESRLSTLDRELSDSKADCQRVRSRIDALVRENESAKHSQLERERAAAMSKGKSPCNTVTLCDTGI